MDPDAIALFWRGKGNMEKRLYCPTKGLFCSMRKNKNNKLVIVAYFSLLTCSAKCPVFTLVCVFAGQVPRVVASLFKVIHRFVLFRMRH